MFGRYSGATLVHDIDQVTTGPIFREEVAPVKTARVVCANYPAIAHDFPQVFGPDAKSGGWLSDCEYCDTRKGACRHIINDWLIRNAAFISQPHIRPNEVNSIVEFGDNYRLAYRPPGYGRGVILPVDTPGKLGEASFLDVKGAGVAPDKTPSHAPHSNGLEYLGYAIADFFYGWVVDTIFARTQPGYSVLPVYAVVDLGFDIVDGWHGTAPAGLHIRRAHSRPAPGEFWPVSGSDRERLLLHLELLLRSFGLSTTGEGTAFTLADPDKADLLYIGEPVKAATDQHREKAAEIAEIIRSTGSGALEIMNVQATNEGDWDKKTLEIFDMGQFEAYRDFTNPVANTVRGTAFRVGRILKPSDPSFVRPDHRFAVDTDLCRRHSVNAYGFYVAQAFRNQHRSFSQQGVEKMLRIARLKVLRRDTEWASRLFANSQGN